MIKFCISGFLGFQQTLFLIMLCLVSTPKKAKYLSKIVTFGGKKITLFSIDGTTWSSKKDELHEIQERQERQRLALQGLKPEEDPKEAAPEEEEEEKEVEIDADVPLDDEEDDDDDEMIPEEDEDDAPKPKGQKSAKKSPPPKKLKPIKKPAKPKKKGK